MNELLAFQLFRDAGVPAPRTSYARVYVTVQGRQDAPTRACTVVENPDEEFMTVRGLAKSGAIFKPVATNVFADLGADGRYNQTYDPKTTLSAGQAAGDRLRPAGGTEAMRSAAQVGDDPDLDETARYLAVIVFLSDLDGLLGPGQNYYLYSIRGRRNSRSSRGIRIIPRQFFRGTQSSREQLSIHHPWSESSRFLDRLFVSRHSKSSISLA